MSVEAPKFTRLVSRCVVLNRNDVDTDQIIPARFLKVTDKLGLGAQLFCDWRYNDDGSPKADFVLNTPEAAGTQVLIAGRNFGCGSSREHAPWALVGFGFRAVVSPLFADIFKNNSLKNGLLPVTISPGAHEALIAARAANPAMEVTVDLESQTVSWPGSEPQSFPTDAFSRTCLLQVAEFIHALQESRRIRITAWRCSTCPTCFFS